MSETRMAVVIEDDPDARELTQLVLTQSGFTVVTAPDGPAGIEAVRQHNPILTTLDVQMPGMDGFAVAARLREFSLTYLIMITSMDGEIDIISGFEAGADDYLIKPFRPRELRARANSMLKRPRARANVPGAQPAETSWAAQLAAELGDNPLPPLPGLQSSPVAAPVAAQTVPAPPVAAPQVPAPPVAAPAVPPPAPKHAAPIPAPAAAAAPAAAPAPAMREPLIGRAPAGPAPIGVLSAGGLQLDATSGHATYDGHPLDLTPAEFSLLSTLMRTGRRVRSKADLVLALRGHSHVISHFVNEADKRTVDTTMSVLRSKLGDDSDPAKLIETVRGVGYRMAV